MSKQSRRIAAIMLIILAVLIPLAITQFNRDVDLSGAAFNPNVEQESTDVPAPPPPPDPPTEVPPPPDPPTEVPPPPPTEVPPTAVPPTPVPPTEVPPTEVPPTEAPPTEAELISTEDVSLIPEVTAEATDAAADTVLAVALAVTCTTDGVQFGLTNTGADMREPLPYFLDGVESGSIQLSAGESLTLDVGYGSPVLAFAGMELQPETLCSQPLHLTAAVTCTLEDGVIFTVSNMGDAMPNPVDYTITYADASASLTGTLQLGAGEQTEIRAGYGEPVFNTGDYQVPLGERCAAPGQLEGIVWNDANGDGRYAKDELGIADVVVILTDADGQAVDAVTPQAGRYHFTLLQPGEYTVLIKPETLSAGMLATYDADGEADSLAAVTVISAETAVADFGYKPTGTLAGRVWNDVNGDDAVSEAETGIADVSLVITDAGGQSREVQTQEDGRYQVETLLAGHYTVTVKPETLPAGMHASNSADEAAAVDVTAGEVATADFGYTLAAAIDGLVWLDINGDGLYSEAEAGIPGVAVTLTNADGQTLEAQTLEDGRYHFGPLVAGQYTVQVTAETLPAEVKASFDADGGNDATAAVEVANEPVTADFGYEATGSAVISGLVWLELANFGTLDGNEPGLAGVNLALVDSSGLVVATAATDANGWYRFEDLRAGDYTVQLVEKTLPQPYGITFNPDDSRDLQTAIPVAVGEEVQKINFGIVGTF